LDFGSDKTATTSFTVQMPANTVTSALIRFALSDGRCVRAWVESVGGDHLDLRDSEGLVQAVMFSALRKAVINR
jgi:hypothetical protein